MGHDLSKGQAADGGHVTRAVEVTLDPSPSQERWLRSYVGSMRVAYNWALEQVADNLHVRRDERARGVPEGELTPALSWSRASLTAAWREVRDEVHPWHRDVSVHAFRTGLDNAALALKNFSESRTGKRRGAKVGFPRFKNRHCRQAVTFVEFADGVDHRHWINPDTRTHVRLMLPRRAGEGTWERHHTRPRSQQAAGRDRRSEVAWLHTHQPDVVREVWRLCESGRAKVQALTIKHEGGRWKGRVPPAPARRLDPAAQPGRARKASRRHGRCRRRPEAPGHVGPAGAGADRRARPRSKPARARPTPGPAAAARPGHRSLREGLEEPGKLLRRRAKLYGKIVATRNLYLHELSRRLAGGFDVICIEDLNVAGMARRKGLRNGRSVAEASMGELTRQLDYKTTDRSARLVRVGRFYPSSQTCSQCGTRTKLALWQRVYDCDHCGLTLDRDVNAARNIRAEGQRLLREQQLDVASIRGETQNGEPRLGETEPVPQAPGGHGSSEAATDPAATPEVAA